MRYRLRTLLIALAVAPPVLAGYYFVVSSLPDAPRLLAGVVAGTLAVCVFLLLPIFVLDWLDKRSGRTMFRPQANLIAPALSDGCAFWMLLGGAAAIVALCVWPIAIWAFLELG